MEGLEESTRELLANGDLDVIVLAGPEVLDELTLAARATLRETVALGAREFLDILGIIIADVGTEATLIGGFTGAVLSELGTLGVGAAIVGTLLPGVHDLKRLLVVLGNDETSVEVDLAELVLVVLMGRIGGKCHGVGVGVKVPVVHDPLKGEVEMIKDGVRVKINAGLVLLENLGHDRGLLPGSATVLISVDVDVVVLVTVDLGWPCVSEWACRKVQ